MTQNEFKIGDRVRSKVAIYTIPTGCSGVITAVMPDGRYKVRLDGEAERHGWYASKDLELIESFDRKTAFLTELRELLRKYDATIYGGLSETHNDDVIFVSIGDDDIAYRNGCGEEYANITPENIMDFDKE